jgi:hypothetical protein
MTAAVCAVAWVAVCTLYTLSCAMPVSAYIPKVVYVTRARDLNASNATSGSRQELAIASNADDSPLEQLDLPFKFPFFGEDIVRLYASPNGALFLQKDNRCGSAFLGTDCSLDDYTGMIGMVLYDFNPSISDNATMAYYSNDNEVYVSVSNMIEFGQTEDSSRLFDFGMSVFSDGSILLQYEKIPDINDDVWMAGLRPGQPYEDTYVITEEQRQGGLSNWYTATPGVYPNRADVSDGRETQFCPISTTWCMTPNVYHIEAPPPAFVFTPLSIACVDDIDIAYYEKSSANTGPIIPCDRVDSDGNTQYSCAPFSPASAGVTTVLVLAWRWSSPGGGLYSDLPVDTFAIYLLDDGAGITDPYANAAEKNCSINTVNACDGTNCELCRHDLDCLGLPCQEPSTAVYTGYPLPMHDLYMNYSCDGTCSFVSDLDDSDVCCNNALIDCDGKCNGTAVVGLDPEGGDEYVCCLSGALDCFGRCDGVGTYDTCGVCRLPGDKGPECKTYFTVDTGYDDGVMYTFYSPIYNGTDESYLYNLTFRNTNDTDVLMTMDLYNDDEKYAPVVTLPDEEITVPALSSIVVAVYTSISELLSGNKTRWEAKTIRVMFWRPEIFTYKISMDVKIYPDTNNCSLVSLRETCISLPGCMHCYHNPGYRVLYIADNDCPAPMSGNESGAIDGVNETNTSQCRRDLFSNVIPSSTNANIGEPSEDGVCSNGWRSTDCRSYDREPNSSRDTYPRDIAIGACLFFVSFITLFGVFHY